MVLSLPLLTFLSAAIASFNAMRHVVLKGNHLIDAKKMVRDTDKFTIAGPSRAQNGTCEQGIVMYYDDDPTNFEMFKGAQCLKTVTVAAKGEHELSKGQEENLDRFLPAKNPHYTTSLRQWLETGYGVRSLGKRLIHKDGVLLDATSGITVTQLNELSRLIHDGMLQAAIFDWDLTLTMTNGLPCASGQGLQALMRTFNKTKIEFTETNVVDFFFGMTVNTARHTALKKAFQDLKKPKVNMHPTRVYILTKNRNVPCMADFISVGLLDGSAGDPLPDGWHIISTKAHDFETKYEAFQAMAGSDILDYLGIPRGDGSEEVDELDEFGEVGQVDLDGDDWLNM